LLSLLPSHFLAAFSNRVCADDNADGPRRQYQTHAFFGRNRCREARRKQLRATVQSALQAAEISEFNTAPVYFCLSDKGFPPARKLAGTEFIFTRLVANLSAAKPPSRQLPRRLLKSHYSIVLKPFSLIREGRGGGTRDSVSRRARREKIKTSADVGGSDAIILLSHIHRRASRESTQRDMRRCIPT